MILEENQEAMSVGFIKAKFPLAHDEHLAGNTRLERARTLGRVRVTEHAFYIGLGHTDIRCNAEARRILQQIAALDGKITRLDFYVDYCGALNFELFYALHNNGKRPYPTKVVSPTGSTVYVGKRSSARMLRVYDKSAEIAARSKVELGFKVTRIELEVKREALARYLHLFLTRNTLQILQDIQELYGLRNFCMRNLAYPQTLDQRPKPDLLAFVERYKRILRRAYLSDPEQFLAILGIHQVE